MQSSSLQRFDPEILDLIPHRPPMLLINKVIAVSNTESEAHVYVDEQAPFYEACTGVPTWIGLEYMGQTAALMAGFQRREGVIEEHLGYLLGVRKYDTCIDYFISGTTLSITCCEAALVGKSLATFECAISEVEGRKNIATAMLSVFRKPIL